MYIISQLCRNCPNCRNLVCVRHRLAKLVWRNYMRTLKMIPGERFQFSHSIDEIVETPIISLQVKKTQDGPMKGIYNISTMIWRGNRARSPTVQSVRQNSLFCWRFLIHRKLKKIAGFDSPCSNVQSKNMSLHIFWRTPWEVPPKVSFFPNHPKIFFRVVNRQKPRWKIHDNYPMCGKISLKISTAFFMLIMRFEKFHGILIVGSIKIKKILPKPAKLKIIRKVDRHIGSTRSRNEVKVGSFITPLYLLKSLN